LETGDLLAAERSFRKALDQDSQSVDALYGLGWVYHLSGSGSRARDYFMRCLRIDSNDYRGYKGLGSLALGEGNFPIAMERFGEALARSPGDLSVLNSMALAHMGAGRYREAADLLGPLLERNPSKGELGLNLAESQFRLKESEAALETIASALDGGVQERRFEALLLELRARILVQMTSGRLDPDNCSSTLPPLLETLAIADKDLAAAESIGVDLPNLNAARLRVHRRRSRILEECPLSNELPSEN
jgi:tetratricopeptide (TPR) repeat protein